MLAQHVMVPPRSDWCGVCMCVCRDGRGTRASRRRRERGRGRLRIQNTTVCIDRGTRGHGKVCECRELGWGFDGETGSLHICMPICGGMQHAEERMRYLGRTNSSVSLSLGGRLVSFPRGESSPPHYARHPASLPIPPSMLTAVVCAALAIMAVTPGSCFALWCCHPLDRGWA